MTGPERGREEIPGRYPAPSVVMKHLPARMEDTMVQLSRRTLLLAGSAWAVTALAPARMRAQDGARPALPIPAELRADAGGTIRLDARNGSMRFMGNRETATYG